jgi:hypothetical protein
MFINLAVLLSMFLLFAVLIAQSHVGHVFGQFMSREIKAPGWQFSGNPHELAQQNWANLINSLGGDACFANSSGTI